MLRYRSHTRLVISTIVSTCSKGPAPRAANGNYNMSDVSGYRLEFLKWGEGLNVCIGTP